MTAKPAPAQIDSWQAAEKNAAVWMRYWGHRDAKVTQGGPDGGIDVRSSRALAQVKFEAAQVGAPAVQRLVGARGRQDHLALYFFSGAGYARPAIDYAEIMDVALFKYGLDGSMTAVNRTAKAVTRQKVRPLAADLTPVQKAEVEVWMRAAAERASVQSAADAGWLRRNGWLICGLVCMLWCIASLAEAVGLTDPPPGQPRVSIGPVIVPGLIGIGSILLWRALNRRRRVKAAKVADLPRAGLAPKAAVTYARGLPGTRAGATQQERMEAVQAVRLAMPWGDTSAAKAVVAAATDINSR